MSRRRYISTDISTDTQVNRLARSGGDFAAMLYTWLIPHADDEGIIYGDEEEIILQVIPGRRDKSLQDVVAALEAMVSLDLIAWDRAGRRILFPAKSFYKYQTYIRDERRRDAPKPPPVGETRRPTPPNADEQRAPATNGAQPRSAAQNTAVPRTSPQITANSGSRASGASLSHSPSPSLSPSHSEEPEATPLAPTERRARSGRVFTAVVAVCGYEEKEITKTARGEINGAVKEIVDAGGDAPDVWQRADAFIRRYDRDKLTPSSLKKHWPTLARNGHLAVVPADVGAIPDAEKTPIERAWDDATDEERSIGWQRFIGKWKAEHDDEEMSQ